jgi:hypothetical protein
MTEKVIAFPTAKPKTTSEEFLQDLAKLAKEDPEGFSELIICVRGRNELSYHIKGTMRLVEAIGLMEISKITIMDNWESENV